MSLGPGPVLDLTLPAGGEQGQYICGQGDSLAAGENPLNAAVDGAWRQFTQNGNVPLLVENQPVHREVGGPPVEHRVLRGKVGPLRGTLGSETRRPRVGEPFAFG